jgi:hypothetical protein
MHRNPRRKGEERKEEVALPERIAREVEMDAMPSPPSRTTRPASPSRTTRPASPSRTSQAAQHRCPGRFTPTQPPTPAADAAADSRSRRRRRRHRHDSPRDFTISCFFSWGSGWSLFFRGCEGANGPEWLGYLLGPAQPNGTSWLRPFFLRAKFFRPETMPPRLGMAETNEA